MTTNIVVHLRNNPKSLTLQHDNRKNVFISNLKLIQKHNAEHALGLHTFALGVNKFADLTSEEFVNTYNGYQAEAFEGLPKVNIESTGDEPESVDWRDEVILKVI